VSFSTFNTATTGLAAAQRALDATSQNIVNSNTPGYSRQRVLLEAVGPTTAASFHTGQKAVFGGVRVADVSRIRDAFLEATRAAAGARQSAIDSQTDILTGAELLLSEPGETGLQGTLDSFYSAWHDLSNNAKDSAAGSVVIERGRAVANQLKSVADGLAAQWTTAYDNLDDVVSQINQNASDLAKVNGAIRANEASGKSTSEMRDTRDLLVRKLADLTGAAATTNEDGEVSVSINGVNIISGTTWQPVTQIGAHDISTASSDPPGLTVGNYVISVESGKAAGILATMRTDLPTLAAKVDSVATTLLTAVNTIYATGYAPDGSTGNTFFAGTNAMNLSVVPTDGGALSIAKSAGVVDGTVGRRIGDLADDAKAASVLGSAGPSVQWRQLTTALGVQVQSLKTAKGVQDAVVASAEDAVQSDAGVNLDEEMSNMMLFQRAYQASARVITTADELLDTLINRTGRVGL
jgi:flagellar hook-associated protein 1 FlgK